MIMKTTEKGSKKFTKDEKLKIIQECKDKGVKLTCEKYGIYPASYYYWKNKLLMDGEDGLTTRRLRSTTARVKQLEKELETLKLLFAEEQLQSRLKDDLLKKKYPKLRR